MKTARNPEDLEIRLAGTALKPKWISREALIRNALFAAEQSGNPDLIDAVRPYTSEGPAFLRDAARRALRRLRNQR